MGVSAFMLFLFIMYAFGLAGMCARRKHKNYKQACHRGTSSNFLMASTGFYFLFSWLIVLICIVLYVPGITIRHLACKPAIELDSNEVVKVRFNLIFFSDILCNRDLIFFVVSWLFFLICFITINFILLFFLINYLILDFDYFYH